MTTTRDVTRYQPPGSLYVKRPAKATAVNRTELMTAGMYERKQLRAGALRLVRRGEIEVLRREVWDHEARQWTMVVRRLKPARRRWPWVLGGVVAVLLALFGAGWWLLSTMSSEAVIGSCALVLVLFGFWMTRARSGSNTGGRIVEVITRVRIG